MRIDQLLSSPVESPKSPAFPAAGEQATEIVAPKPLKAMPPSSSPRLRLLPRIVHSPPLMHPSTSIRYRLMMPNRSVSPPGGRTPSPALSDAQKRFALAIAMGSTEERLARIYAATQKKQNGISNSAMPGGQTKPMSLMQVKSRRKRFAPVDGRQKSRYVAR
jgi:hypothetical protein